MFPHYRDFSPWFSFCVHIFSTTDLLKFNAIAYHSGLGNYSSSNNNFRSRRLLCEAACLLKIKNKDQRISLG